VQEALHNVAKHAGANTVTIEMTREGDFVRLLVEDDGIGMATKAKAGRRTFGLAGMHERIGNIGGKMKVTSARGRGTRIEVNAPIAGTGFGTDRGLPLSNEAADAVAQGA